MLPSLPMEYAPNALTKSGKRKISTLAKPLPSVASYSPAVSSRAPYETKLRPSCPRYSMRCSPGTTIGS